jgi:hypothetical protein
MWGGGGAPATVIAGFPDPGGRRVNATQGLGEIIDKAFERHVEGRSPPNQDVVVARPHPVLRRQPDQFSKPPTDAVALDGIADLPGYGKSHTHGSILAPVERL